MSKFKIFYSWQSDLPGNKTRNFIRECIDEAIDLAQETETIEAERDEATKGVTGSPDIVETLFSKIDKCDLFVADISLCFMGVEKTEKRAPNPNVLLELGYAVKILGWKRVICLCNADFGTEYPFDVAHNRITVYSFEGQSKKEVKGDISRIIFTNIRDLRGLTPRANENKVTHIVGTYDFEKQKVTGVLIPLSISNRAKYNQHNEELVQESLELLDRIKELTKTVKGNPQNADNETSRSTMDSTAEYKAIQPMKGSLIDKPHSVIYKEADKKGDKELIKLFLNDSVSDEFFELGGLKKSIHFFGSDAIFDGTQDEKEKYEKLQELSYRLCLLNVRREYLKTFDGMIYIPLAIQNISTVQDSSIRVTVKIKQGEPVVPNEDLICDQLNGIQSSLCREDENDVGIIDELFGISEDGTIHIEEERGINYHASSMISLPEIFEPQKNEEDYKAELEEYIANPAGDHYYEFNVEKLRAGECRWFSQGVLIKPKYGKVKIQYQIHSAQSAGDLSGELVYEE